MIQGDSNMQPRAATVTLLALVAGASGCGSRVSDDPAEQPAQTTLPAAPKAGGSIPDLSGRPKTGNASFYAKQFAGREMADGTKMDPAGDNAASKTLPLGTTATVTNVATGQSATVTIHDRGPYAKGRIVDLSPSTAAKIGVTPREGVAEVTVSPISVPLPNGGSKAGTSGAATTPPDSR
jgi:rare lipoprotein A